LRATTDRLGEVESAVSAREATKRPRSITSDVEGRFTAPPLVERFF
jgi:hypothetical protein